MSRLWKWIKNKDISKTQKIRLFLFLNCMNYSILGFLLWLFIRSYGLGSYDWAICFAGYPGFFVGFIGGYIFLCHQ